MKTTVSQSDFHDAFRACDRLDNFSYEGRELLFNYFEELEADTGEEAELDVIAICCEFSEESVEDIAANYSIEAGEDDDLSEVVEAYLIKNTSVVGQTDAGDFVYVSF